MEDIDGLVEKMNSGGGRLGKYEGWGLVVERTVLVVVREVSLMGMKEVREVGLMA